VLSAYRQRPLQFSFARLRDALDDRDGKVVIDATKRRLKDVKPQMARSFALYLLHCAARQDYHYHYDFDKCLFLCQLETEKH
jgi:hypothetical protein